jgi:hypothetical protein
MEMSARSERPTPAGRWYREPAVVSAMIGALAVVLAAIVGGVFDLVTPPHPTAPRSPYPITEPPPAAEETKASPVTFDVFAARMTDPDQTELQRRLFLQEHLGRRVEWDGYVRRVRPASSADGRRRYLLGLSPDADSPVVASCSLAAGWANDLRELTLGQHVTVSCVLEGYGAAGPTLGDCRLRRI